MPVRGVLMAIFGGPSHATLGITVRA